MLGGNKFSEKVTVLLRGIELGILKDNDPLPLKRGELRKLACFPDKEGKQRVVAVLDYFSQSVLKPLHHYLFKVLKKIPQDRTFSQSGFLGGYDNVVEEIYSVDLKSATDRFPIDLIVATLLAILPSEYVLA